MEDDRGRAFWYVKGGLYAEQIARRLDRFPRSSFLFIRSGGFCQSPAGQLQRAFDFLGLPQWHTRDLTPRNPRSYPAPLQLSTRAKLEPRFAESNARVAELTGISRPKRLPPFRLWSRSSSPPSTRPPQSGEPLRSALAQSHTAVEVIVVDDASTDDTARIVAALASEHPCVRLIRAEHGGQAAARNLANAAAGGAFIAPLDADDLWDERKIELQVERALAAPELPGMVYCLHYRIDEDDRIVSAPGGDVQEGRVVHRLYYRNFVGTGSAPLFLKSAVVEAGGYTKAGNSEDALLQLRIARRHPVAAVAERLVGYRVTRGSHTRKLESALHNWMAARTFFEAEWPGLPRSLRRWTRSVRWLQFAETMTLQRRWGRMNSLAALDSTLAHQRVR